MLSQTPTPAANTRLRHTSQHRSRHSPRCGPTFTVSNAVTRLSFNSMLVTRTHACMQCLDAEPLMCSPAQALGTICRGRMEHHQQWWDCHSHHGGSCCHWRHPPTMYQLQQSKPYQQSYLMCNKRLRGLHEHTNQSGRDVQGRCCQCSQQQPNCWLCQCINAIPQACMLTTGLAAPIALT
jgi:hypothetical protein